MTKFKETEAAISLHGLGFLQVKLDGRQRLHVWHPDLPRRSCFHNSQVHDHRFSFESRVIVGTQVNHSYAVHELDEASKGEATHVAYLHEGPRSRFGNRPWVPSGLLAVAESLVPHYVHAGENYQMRAYDFHSTEPGGDGRVATIMQKVGEDGDRGARSLCAVGVRPDVDFDRFQMSEDDMWRIVREVLSCSN